MAQTLVERDCPGLDLPEGLTKTQEAVLEMWNAFHEIGICARSPTQAASLIQT